MLAEWQHSRFRRSTYLHGMCIMHVPDDNSMQCPAVGCFEASMHTATSLKSNLPSKASPTCNTHCAKQHTAVSICIAVPLYCCCIS